MGHDITAFSNVTKEEVAYLRYSAGNNEAREIYIALNCRHCDGGISGYGEILQFSEEQLNKALKRFPNTIFQDEGKEKPDKERTFLVNCLNNLDDNGMISIEFS